MSVNTTPPADGNAWQKITLPDIWRKSRPEIYGNAWYRFRFNLSKTPDTLWAIYLKHLNQNAAVYINDVFIGDGGQFEDPISRNWHRPLFFNIPTSLLRPGENIVHVRLKTNSVLGYLHEPCIGPQEKLSAPYNRQYFVQVTLNQIIVAIMLAITIGISILWYYRKQDSIYLWFALTSGVWSLRTTNLFWQNIPLSGLMIDWLFFILAFWFVVLIGFFVHRYLNMVKPRFEKIVLTVGMVCTLFSFIFVFISPTASNIAISIAKIPLMFFGGYLIYITLNHYRKTRSAETGLLSGAGFCIFVLGVHDISIKSGFLAPDHIHLFQYGMILVMMVFSWSLANRYAKALELTEAVAHQRQFHNDNWIEKSNPLRLSKISRPIITLYIPRPSLDRALDIALERPFVWISGPPGSGKTSLVSHYVDSRNLSYIWFQLDSRDNDAATFFAYLQQAVIKYFPDAVNKLPLFTPEYRLGLSAYTQNFFETLFSFFPSNFVIVLDNFQVLNEKNEFNKHLKTAFSLIPSGGHIIIISRNDISPNFASLRVEQSMTQLNWQDLKLNTEDTRQVSESLLGKSLTEKNVNELHQQSQGWMAGLLLLLDDAQSPHKLADQLDHHSHQNVFDYIAAESFNKLEYSTKRFLIQLSLLPSFSAISAQEISGDFNSKMLLGNLLKQNHFIQTSSEHPDEYQFHPLFQKFLQSSAARFFTDQEMRDTKSKTGRWLAKQGLFDDAVQYLLDSQDWTQLIDICHANAPSLMEQGRNKTLHSWISKLPPQFLENDPWLKFWYGKSMPNSETALEHFVDAFTTFQEKDDHLGQAKSLGQIIEHHLEQQDNYIELTAWLNKMMDLAERKHLIQSDQWSWLVFLGLAAWNLVKKPGSSSFPWRADAETLLYTPLSHNLKSRLALALTNYYLIHNDPAKILNISNSIISDIIRIDLLPDVQLRYLQVIAINQWLNAQHQNCLETVQECMELAEESGVRVDPFLLVHALFSTLNFEPDKLPELLDQFDSLTKGQRSHVIACNYFRGWQYLWENALSKARSHFSQCIDMSENINFYPYLCLAQMGSIVVDIKERNINHAKITLETTEKECSNDSIILSMGVACLRTYMELDSANNIREQINELFALGKRHSILAMPFWQQDIMATLCAESLSSEQNQEYSQELIIQHNISPPDKARALSNWPWPLQIFSFSGFAVFRYGEPIKLGRKSPKKPLDILKCLIAFGSQGVSVERIIESLWPDLDGDAAYQTFSTTLHRLRKLLGSSVIIQKEGLLSLDLSQCWLDTQAFDLLIEEINKNKNGESVDQYMDKLQNIYKGHFLQQDHTAVWALSSREKYRSKLVSALDRIGKQLHKNGDYATELSVYQKGLEFDDLSETFYQGTMRACLELGLHSDGLAMYQRCRQMLNRIMNVNPSSRTEALRRSLQKN